jgi:hypothetical protein
MQTHTVENPGNKPYLDNEFQFDEEVYNPVITNSTKSNKETWKTLRWIWENLLIEEKEDYEGNKLIELLCAGAGIGEVILHTGAIHVLKYKEAMIGADWEHWNNSIYSTYEEHEQMIENTFWKPINLKDLSADSQLLSTTWATKKKDNGKYRARITARAFLQEDGVHYFSHSNDARVANELTIKFWSLF